VGEHILWAKLGAFMDPVSVAERVAQRLRDRHPGYTAAVIENPLGQYGIFVSFLTRLVSGFMMLALLALLTSIGGIFSVSWTHTLDSWHALGIRRALGQPRYRTLLAAIRSTALLVLAAGIVGSTLSILGVSALARSLSVTLVIRPVWGLWAALAILGAAILGGGIPALWAARLVPADTIRTGRQ
jgi:ABC-type antimicrobial peptide transport system permease subunit